VRAQVYIPYNIRCKKNGAFSTLHAALFEWDDGMEGWLQDK